MRRILMALSGLAVLWFTTGCGILPVRFERDFTRTAEWHAYQRIIVHTQNGDVKLAPGEGELVRIDGHLRADLITRDDAEKYIDQIEIVMRTEEEDPSTFIVELKVPRAIQYKSVGADFNIRVPVACAAEIDTSNGEIHVRKLKDRVVLDSSNGEITAEDIVGEVHVSTSNGSIEVRTASGSVTADTSNGDIEATNITGDCILTTSNGSIEATEIQGGVRARSSNGWIDVRARPEVYGQVALETSNGRITAEVPASIKGKMDIRTSNGNVDVQTGSAVLADIMTTKNRFRAEMNGGGIGCIQAYSTNGTVRILCR